MDESWKATKDRRANQANSRINITGIIDAASATGWWNTSFPFRKLITINKNNVEATQTNFPVLIDITDDDLRVFVEQSNGNDIAFAKSGIGIKYNHQIELFESSTGHLVAWVNVTSLSSTVNNYFYIYYGNATCENQQNPSGVWDGKYHGVWHLNESSGSLQESTIYENDGTAYNSPIFNVAGQIDGAMQFIPNDYVSCGDPADGSLDFGTNDFTLEFWVKTEETATRAIIDKVQTLLPTGGYSVWIVTGCIRPIFAENNNLHVLDTGIKVINDNIWHYIAITFDRDGKAIYYVDGGTDGSQDISGWGGSTNNALPFYLARGELLGLSDYFTGTIDEVRVSQTALSEAWINTSYINQNSTSTFYTVASQTSRYLTITVENLGSANLKTDHFTLLVNGTQFECICNRSNLFPLNSVRFYSTTQIFSGSKSVKIIADNGVEDKYYYDVGIGP